MHVFIAASVRLFPVLEWENAHLDLILLSVRAYHLIVFFIIELHFGSKSRWVLEWDYIHLVLVHL